MSQHLCEYSEEDPRSPLLIVCGDFNGGPECGAVQYLEDGKVGPSFLEDGELVSSKGKICPMSKPLIDVVSSVSTRPEPPTLVVAELISQMVKDTSAVYGKPDFCDDVIVRLTKCYDQYATFGDSSGTGVNGKIMNVDDVERWLIDINKQVGRGSEFRTAAKEMGWTDPPQEEGSEEPVEKPRITLPQDGLLTLEGFLNVYTFELRGGKFWGIHYDLSIMGQPLPDLGRFEARYDRMYCTAKLMPVVVLDTIATTPCPNDVEPSDHLPVAASFRISELN